MARNLNLDTLGTERTVTVGGSEYQVKDLVTSEAFVVKATLKEIFEHDDYDEAVDKLQWKLVKTYMPDLPKKAYDDLPVMKKGALVRFLVRDEGDGDEAKNAS